jgi:hypothetical protein
MAYSSEWARRHQRRAQPRPKPASSIKGVKEVRNHLTVKQGYR